jgi:hypothetical protein
MTDDLDVTELERILFPDDPSEMTAADFAALYAAKDALVERYGNARIAALLAELISMTAGQIRVRLADDICKRCADCPCGSDGVAAQRRSVAGANRRSSSRFSSGVRCGDVSENTNTPPPIPAWKARRTVLEGETTE